MHWQIVLQKNWTSLHCHQEHMDVIFSAVFDRSVDILVKYFRIFYIVKFLWNLTFFLEIIVDLLQLLMKTLE